MANNPDPLVERPHVVGNGDGSQVAISCADYEAYALSEIERLRGALEQNQAEIERLKAWREDLFRKYGEAQP